MRPHRLTLRPVRPGKSHPETAVTQAAVTETPERDAPGAPATQEGTHLVAAATQGASPGESRRRKGATRGDARRLERDSRRDGRLLKRDTRRDTRVAARARMRQRATVLATRMTGRHYERVGFATRGRRIAAYLSLTAVLFCVGFMSWSGEFGWAVHELGWAVDHALMVPVSLDIAAVTCTLLALDQIDKGESGMGFRLVAAALVALGAWINWRYALRSGNVTAEVFFPVMSLAAYTIVHLVMRAARKEARRRQHGLKSRERAEPLPNFGLLVWLPFIGQPREAMDAWKEAVALRLAKALALTQVGAAATDGDAGRDQDEEGESHGETGDEDQETHDDAPPPPEYPDLSQMRQVDAIRWTLANVGEEPLVALRHLRSHGWPDLKPQRIHDERRRDRERRNESQPATGPDADATTQVAPDTEGAAG